MGDVRSEVRRFILEEVLIGEAPENLSDDRALITTGVLDSMSMVRLVAFLEECFDIEIQAHEATVDNLNSVDEIVGFVNDRRGTTE